jgi:hypothetical protein
MRDPMDFFGQYFWEMLACWSIVIGLPILWSCYHIIRGIRAKIAARRGGGSPEIRGTHPSDRHSSR